MCRTFSSWLARQPTLVGLSLMAAGSPYARARFPTLDHERTLEEITVVGDDGAVWTGSHAWVMCLWATAAHRPLAESLARPSRLPLARGAAHLAAGIRHVTTSRTARSGGDYPDHCAGTCAPPDHAPSQGLLEGLVEG
ncbi:hypothetical protein C7S10_03010 [Nocardioides currus]|uniref:Uncharacterized protein n=2 Tax=Nocardioides currus TaxID=2133958 RepID=A0A2R7Z3Q7_9ACTN|nr:hypothetical protein C7S10_03010 [Nocardioides currus]